MSTENKFVQLASVDVSQHVEKKANLSYLSWAWAVDQLMRADPTANWEFHEPQMFGNTMMVSCTVTAFGKPMSMHLPVMDHRNRAIENPDAFAVNKNMMRCLVKCIAVHGLGLYIYAGEDLPADDDGNRRDANQPPKPALTPDTKFWTNAKAAYLRDGNLDKVKQHVTISAAHEKQLIAEAEHDRQPEAEVA